MSTPEPTAEPTTGNGPAVGAISIDWPRSGPTGSVIPRAAASMASSEFSRSLLWQNMSTEQHSQWLLNPSTWDPTFILFDDEVPAGWRIVGTGDFLVASAGVDIMWENLTTVPHRWSFWYMNTYTWSGIYSYLENVPPAGHTMAAIGDFNGDTHPDLVWQDVSTGEGWIWLMAARHRRRETNCALPKVPLGWRIVGTGDFDGDGQTDLVWENLTEPDRTMRRSIWFMDGCTYTQRYTLLNRVDVPDGWSIATVGDVDADGMPDLVWQNLLDGRRSIWLMNGTVHRQFVLLHPTVPNTNWDIAAVFAFAGRVVGRTTTTGGALDATGYTVTLCCIQSTTRTKPIETNGENFFVGLLPGTYTLTLGDIASNCTTPNNPVQVSTGYGMVDIRPFYVSCRAASGTWTKQASMSNGRFWGVSGVVNDILYLAGGTGGGGTLGSVVAYNPMLNTWTAKASMSFPRSGAAGGAVLGSLYVAGGFGPTGLFEAYNPATNSWSPRPGMPTARSEAAAGVIGNTLYIAGGNSGTGVLATLEAYNATANTWTTKAPMPTARSNAAAAVVDGILYVVGGGIGNGVSNVVEAYNPVTNVWSTRAPMPSRMNGATAAAVNGILYVVGGSDGGISHTTIEAYNPATNTWTTTVPAPELQFTTASSGAIGGAIYVAGGYRLGGLSTLYSYQP